MECKNRRCERKRKWGKGYKYRGGSPWQRGPSDELNYCTWTTWDTCVSPTLQGQILSLHGFITDDNFPKSMLMFSAQQNNLHYYKEVNLCWEVVVVFSLK